MFSWLATIPGPPFASAGNRNIVWRTASFSVRTGLLSKWRRKRRPPDVGSF